MSAMRTNTIEPVLEEDPKPRHTTDVPKDVQAPETSQSLHKIWPETPAGISDIARSFLKAYRKYPDAELWNKASWTKISGNGGNRILWNETRKRRPLQDGHIHNGSYPRLLLVEPWLHPFESQFLETQWETDLIWRTREFRKAQKTPFILFDLSRLRENYDLFSGAIQNAQIYYPVKTNDHPDILSALGNWGSGFEAASWCEVERLLDLGVEPNRIIFGATIKPLDHIAAAYDSGIRLFACDSISEITKLAQVAPGCDVYLRLAIHATPDTIFPLSEKFGASPDQIEELLLIAKEVNLNPCGLSFHVGSQSMNPQSWWIAIAACARAWDKARRAGFELSFLNLGGGIPIRYCQPVPAKDIFLSHILLALKSHFQCLPHLILEPGRSMVGDAALMVTTVIGKAKREDGDWLYVDAGTYQGLVEAAQGGARFYYAVYAEGAGPLHEYSIGGPTCDSGDIVSRKAMLPELDCGDTLYIMNTGAYTNVCATSFNGFPPPEIYFIGDEEDQQWTS